MVLGRRFLGILPEVFTVQNSSLGFWTAGLDCRSFTLVRSASDRRLRSLIGAYGFRFAYELANCSHNKTRATSTAASAVFNQASDY